MDPNNNNSSSSAANSSNNNGAVQGSSALALPGVAPTIESEGVFIKNYIQDLAAALLALDIKPTRDDAAELKKEAKEAYKTHLKNHLDKWNKWLAATTQHNGNAAGPLVDDNRPISTETSYELVLESHSAPDAADRLLIPTNVTIANTCGGWNGYGDAMCIMQDNTIVCVLNAPGGCNQWAILAREDPYGKLEAGPFQPEGIELAYTGGSRGNDIIGCASVEDKLYITKTCELDIISYADGKFYLLSTIQPFLENDVPRKIVGTSNLSNMPGVVVGFGTKGVFTVQQRTVTLWSDDGRRKAKVLLPGTAKGGFALVSGGDHCEVVAKAKNGRQIYSHPLMVNKKASKFELDSIGIGAVGSQSTSCVTAICRSDSVTVRADGPSGTGTAYFASVDDAGAFTKTGLSKGLKCLAHPLKAVVYRKQYAAPPHAAVLTQKGAETGVTILKLQSEDPRYYKENGSVCVVPQSMVGALTIASNGYFLATLRIHGAAPSRDARNPTR